LASLGRAEGLKLGAVDLHAAGGGGAESRDGPKQLGLTAACYAGDAEDLTVPYVEIGTLHYRHSLVVHDGELPYAQRHLARLTGLVPTIEVNVAARHVGGHLGGARRG
jgi:hypothetical protein